MEEEDLVLCRNDEYTEQCQRSVPDSRGFEGSAMRSDSGSVYAPCAGSRHSGLLRLVWSTLPGWFRHSRSCHLALLSGQTCSRKEGTVVACRGRYVRPRRTDAQWFGKAMRCMRGMARKQGYTRLYNYHDKSVSIALGPMAESSCNWDCIMMATNGSRGTIGGRCTEQYTDGVKCINRVYFYRPFLTAQLLSRDAASCIWLVRMPSHRYRFPTSASSMLSTRPGKTAPA